MKVDRIIFLDIDGVLNSERWAKKFYKMIKSKENIEGINDLCDPYATNMLIELLNEINAKIVLSSSWRSKTIEETIKDFSTFRHKPFHKLVPYLIGVTPRFKERLIRGEEIQYWINWIKTDKLIKYKLIKEDIEIDENFKYIILDDDNDMLDNQNFIRIDNKIGISKEYIKQIRKYFT